MAGCKQAAAPWSTSLFGRSSSQLLMELTRLSPARGDGFLRALKSISHPLMPPAHPVPSPSVPWAAAQLLAGASNRDLKRPNRSSLLHTDLPIQFTDWCWNWRRLLLLQLLILSVSELRDSQCCCVCVQQPAPSPTRYSGNHRDWGNNQAHGTNWKMFVTLHLCASFRPSSTLVTIKTS